MCEPSSWTAPTPDADPGNDAPLAWNDPTLEAAEQAKCSCGHWVLDHRWSGCEEHGCQCAKSPAHDAEGDA